jgi:DNA-binding CsgD family transcriptional regulator
MSRGYPFRMPSPTRTAAADVAHTPPADAPATQGATPTSFQLLDDAQHILESALLDVAPELSDRLAAYISHSALIIFTEDCTGRPQKKAGDTTITDRVTIAELATIRQSLRDGTAGRQTTAIVGGTVRAVDIRLARTGALLVLTDPVPRAGDVTPEVVERLWDVAATSIRQQVASASPDYLRDSRAESTERARVIAELSDIHQTTLEALLAALRSPQLSDAAARVSAIEVATASMVTLRTASDLDRILTEEPVILAFERLRDDLRPLVRFGSLDVQFIEPPTAGRALPGEIAHAARAIVRSAVLALVDQEAVSRVRVQWDCDGSNLLVNIRDDGPGDLTADAPTVRQLTARVLALSGSLDVQTTSGWGSEMAVVLPLDAPSAPAGPGQEWGLSAREVDVFELVAAGQRNREIAHALSISENTAKFHVSNILRKAGARTRAELGALVH